MTPSPLRRLFGFGLLVAQLGAGGATSLAHARERLDAPRHIESAGDAQCLVVHDATRCVVCAFAHVRAAAPAGRPTAPVPLTLTRLVPPVVAAPYALAACFSGDARAPPSSQG